MDGLLHIIHYYYDSIGNGGCLVVHTLSRAVLSSYTYPTLPPSIFLVFRFMALCLCCCQTHNYTCISTLYVHLHFTCYNTSTHYPTLVPLVRRKLLLLLWYACNTGQNLDKVPGLSKTCSTYPVNVTQLSSLDVHIT